MTILARAVTPLLPDPDDAREWVERELQDPAYAAAEPTLLDRVARAVGDFLAGLFSPEVPDALGPTAAVVALVVVVLLVGAALLIWGRPRRNARSRSADAPELFGAGDARTAAQLRADAAAAAARGEWDAAIADRFRAIARALAERVLADPSPGTTAQGFARVAAGPFPGAEERLRRGATAFDDVRYLRRPGTRELYDDLAGLDDELARTRPRAEVSA